MSTHDTLSQGDAPEDSALNLKQAAARLGVHYMTAYRYVRQGLLPAAREGTAWRIDKADVEAFGIARYVEPSGASTSRADWPARLERCLLDGDETAAWDVVQRALAAGHDPNYCYLDMVAGAMASIGNRWATGELDPADQPLATAVAQRVVAHLGARFRRPGRSRGSVVFGAPRGETHSLPIAIVADLVRLEGFDVLELGADVTPEAFAAAAGRAPRLVAVGIGVVATVHLDTVRATTAAIREREPDVPIVIGGQAVLNPEVADLLGATAWAADGREAVSVIRDLVPRR